MSLYWISFSSPGKHLGCCVVESDDLLGALASTRRLRINPGGEALVFEVPDKDAYLLPLDLRGKLMDTEEWRRHLGTMVDVYVKEVP